ncbi:MAG: hypothetical protein ABW133_03250 [Polyangiaceae bacterium]
MALTCNIDARGKAVRLRLGIFLVVVGLVLLVAWALPAGTAVAWFVTMSTVGIGAFSIFEARAGWCALRAAGFRTSI